MLVATCIGNLGLRHGRHLPVTSTGVHADCARQNSCHTLQQHVAQGSVVHSDQWASYNQVGNLPSVSAHGTVNHSMEFVSPSGVHTQNIESYWNHTKMKLKWMRECAAKEVPSYLDEFMCRERFVKTPREAMNGIMCDIAQQYPF